MGLVVAFLLFLLAGLVDRRGENALCVLLAQRLVLRVFAVQILGWQFLRRAGQLVLLLDFGFCLREDRARRIGARQRGLCTPRGPAVGRGSLLLLLMLLLHRDRLSQLEQQVRLDVVVPDHVLKDCTCDRFLVVELVFNLLLHAPVHRKRLVPIPFYVFPCFLLQHSKRARSVNLESLVVQLLAQHFEQGNSQP